VSPSRREREYARRRYADWQQRQAAKAARHRRNRIIASVVFGLLAVALVVTLVVRAAMPDQVEPVADPSQSAPPTTPAADNPCPVPPAPGVRESPTGGTAPDPATAEDRSWTGTLTTSCGDIGFTLDGHAAPQSVANFVSLASSGFFDGTSCHRLTTSGIFVLQCGDPTATGTGGPGYTWGPIENAPAGDVYPAGTIAMARQGGNAESQGSQFFIVYQDSTIPSDTAGGYSVFGTVTSGLDVVQKIADGGTNGSDESPARPIAIEGVTVQ
jgi:peptidyl-prolyl cis-trans isomerase B (cyclophilin B)